MKVRKIGSNILKSRLTQKTSIKRLDYKLALEILTHNYKESPYILSAIFIGHRIILPKTVIWLKEMGLVQLKRKHEVMRRGGRPHIERWIECELTEKGKDLVKETGGNRKSLRKILEALFKLT